MVQWLTSEDIFAGLTEYHKKNFIEKESTFNQNIDEDYDVLAKGISRNSFYNTYSDWIKFCVEQRDDVRLHRNIPLILFFDSSHQKDLLCGIRDLFYIGNSLRQKFPFDDVMFRSEFARTSSSWDCGSSTTIQVNMINFLNFSASYKILCPKVVQ